MNLEIYASVFTAFISMKPGGSTAEGGSPVRFKVNGGPTGDLVGNLVYLKPP